MIEGLVKSSLHTRLLVFILAVFVAAAGYYSYSNLTIEAFPDPTDTQVQVITIYPGQPSEEVERRVSIPLERALNGVPGLYRLRSISLFGLSLVTLTFEDGVEPLVARQQIMERIPDASLPPGIEPDLGPLATPIGEVYRYTLEGVGADPMTLRTIQDWVVRPALMRVPGVWPARSTRMSMRSARMSWARAASPTWATSRLWPTRRARPWVTASGAATAA